MNQWISVKDRLPEPGQDVILMYRDEQYNNKLKIMPAWRANVGEDSSPNGIWALTGRLAFYGCTDLENGVAWMPLPEPPKEDWT